MSKRNNEKKVVYCYETKERFNSIDEAAKIKGTHRAQLKKAIDNPKKTAGSYHWYTDLDFFNKFIEENGIELNKEISVQSPKKNNNNKNNKPRTSKPIFCYETKEKFDSINEAALKYNISNTQICQLLDNPNRIVGGYHWCTDLNIFNNITTLNDTLNIPIYCYETKERFGNIYLAMAKYNIENKDINIALNKSHKIAGGYHWCTDLAIFDKIKPTDSKNNISKVIYCYETKEKFDSINQAKIKYKIKTKIYDILDNPNKTAGNYHWCTDLTIFDGIGLKSGNENTKKNIYCYETKEKFDSVKDARIKYNIKDISLVLDKPNRTAGNLHWCTSLEEFDKFDLLSGHDMYKIPIYCYETKEKFDSIRDARILTGFNHIQNILDNPNKTACGYHWCTSLDKFNPGDLVYPDSGISIPEMEIVEFIKSIYNDEIITNNKSIISPYELDIYLSDLNLAFEFNGDYWHSEAKGKDRNYHINKTNLCKAKGIQLIHIFEYQYRKNPIIIKSMIMNKLNKNQIKLYARNCEVKLIDDNNITKQFLEENHIQGYVNSSINIGLYCNNILVSLMTFGKSRFDKNIEYELLRYASLRSTNVIGGASKLLKYFEKIYKPKSLISYADISYSNGNLYSKLGFNFIGTSDPDYVSIRNGIVYPRYQTMKHKLSKLLGEENFDINLTEQQNLDNNGFLRIWKCGNLKYLKEYNK